MNNYSTCPTCGAAGLVSGTMRDQYDETIYYCPTSNQCGEWYTMSRRRRHDLALAARRRVVSHLN